MLGLVDILWKTEVIGELYLVRSADKNVGGSVVVMLWVPEVIGKPYYVRSADENVVGSVTAGPSGGALLPGRHDAGGPWSEIRRSIGGLLFPQQRSQPPSIRR